MNVDLIYLISLGGSMIEVIRSMLNGTAIFLIGFFIGGFLMFLLSCLHSARYYDRMIEAESELKKYEDVCEIND